MGRLELAEKLYRTALDYGPTNDIFLGGLAAFLYLHGKPEDAFDAHLKLLMLYRKEGFEAGIKPTVGVLNTLGEKMGWPRDLIAERIEKGIHGLPPGYDSAYHH